MTLRTRLFALVSALVAVTVALVTWTVSARARAAFEALDADRRAALVSQFRREFAREAGEVARRVERIAASDDMARLAVDLAAPRPDDTAHVNDAAPMAAAAGLDFLDIVAGNGTIVSSAHWPARFGYRHPWATGAGSGGSADAFLQPIDLPSGTALGVVAVRPVTAGERRLFVAAGRRLDQQFLQSLVLPAGMRALLYRNLDPEISGRQLIDASGPVAQTSDLEPLIARVRQSAGEAAETIRRPDGSEAFQAIPLKGRDGAVLGVLLVGSSDRDLASLVQRIRWSGFALAGLGIVFGLILSYALAARITRPVEQLAGAALDVAGGNWDVQPHVRAPGEIGALASAFSTMTRQLADQRDRLVQAERVAAWRELARRLAHELKNPLFPLRITVDNLRQARRLSGAEFDEVFNESMGTLTTGLANLNTVIGRFSDFAKMPAPQFERVSPNEIVAQTVRLFQAQVEAPGRPPIRLTTDLDASLGSIRADPEQLGRALQNLLLNAIDAMPRGGDLAVRTRRVNGAARLEVADTGAGLTEEERERLFTPYYTTRQHGTGLGLAIVQSVVADHHGRIRVESEPGRGTTFQIDLPADE